MKKTYHILYTVDGNKNTSFGINIEARDITTAIVIFDYQSNSKDEKNIVGIYDLEALGGLKLNPEAIQKEVELDESIRATKKAAGYNPDKNYISDPPRM